MFDLTKLFTTRTGLLVRIFCTDTKNGRYPIAWLMSDTDGQEYSYS